MPKSIHGKLRRFPKRGTTVAVRLAPLRFLLALVLLSGCAQPAAYDEDDFLETVRRSSALAERWFLSSMREDKALFTYLYDPKEDAILEGQNELRQLMASRLLAAMSAEQPGLLPLHRENLAFILRYWVREEGDIAYIFYDDKSKLGASAMALRTFVASPDFETEHRDRARKMANGILKLMNPEGSFRPWLIEPSYDYDSDYLLTFYSGEAILALLEYARAADSGRHREAAVLAQEYYLERYVAKMAENYYPAYVPWHTLSLRMLYDETGDARYAEAVFRLNDELLKIQDTSDKVGRFYNPESPQYGTPHSSSDAVYTEGLAHAYHVAVRAEDAVHAGRYRSALALAVQNLESLQYGSREAKSFPRPEKAEGGIRISETKRNIRVDSVQHALDAYRAILEAFSP